MEEHYDAEKYDDVDDLTQVLSSTSVTKLLGPVDIFVNQRNCHGVHTGKGGRKVKKIYEVIQ